MFIVWFNFDISYICIKKRKYWARIEELEVEIKFFIASFDAAFQDLESKVLVRASKRTYDKWDFLVYHFTHGLQE